MTENSVDDEFAIISRPYPGLYSQLAPPTRETKLRRRRKKKGAGQGGITGMKKRKLSQEQVNLLEKRFGDEHKLESERKDRLAAELGLDPRQVAVWFQNRRARFKSKKLEEEYSRLRAAHENVVVEKFRLETEVLRLKERLADAEKETRRLSEQLNGGASSNSPSSSVTMTEAMDQPTTSWPGDYVYEDVFFPVFQWMDWVF